MVPLLVNVKCLSSSAMEYSSTAHHSTPNRIENNGPEKSAEMELSFYNKDKDLSTEITIESAEIVSGSESSLRSSSSLNLPPLESPPRSSGVENANGTESSTKVNGGEDPPSIFRMQLRSPSSSENQSKVQPGGSAADEKVEMKTNCDLQSHRRRSITLSDEDLKDVKRRRVSSWTLPQLQWQHNSMAPKKTVLLAQPSDEMVLSPIHVLIRQQVEVFQATEVEVSQPAPGRKNPIKLHQIGLRCVHCRHLTSVKARGKRAVCYPSSISRVYNSVSDMKFAHFTTCKSLPKHVRERLNQIKAADKSSPDQRKPPTDNRNNQCGFASSTAQYYHDTARQMGMVDCDDGVFMSSAVMMSKIKSNCTYDNPYDTKKISSAGLRTPKQHFTNFQQNLFEPKPNYLASFHSSTSVFPGASSLAHISKAGENENMLRSISAALRISGNQLLPATALMLLHRNINKGLLPTPSNTTTGAMHSRNSKVDAKTSTPLATSDDPYYLNPLHCFARRHIEVFIANKEDISAPATGRRNRVLLGQVGIRCIHCATVPFKNRVKRSVCYPPSISGIYHCVSNMKFDHFGNCAKLPQEAKDELTKLRASCEHQGSPPSSGANASVSKSKRSSISMAKYYRDSATRLGLIDTDNQGIRYMAVPSAPALIDSSPSNSTIRQHHGITREGRCCS